LVLCGTTGLALAGPKHKHRDPAPAPAASPAPEAAPVATPAAPAGPISDKEKWWRKTQEDSANAQGEWGTGGHENEHMRVSHQHFIENCGHDVRVVFDWKSFDMQQWLKLAKERHLPDDVVAGYCVYQLYDVGSDCTSDALKPYQRDMLKKVTTWTCHYKRCKDMPDIDGGGRQDVATYAQYSIKGTNLDETYCESNSNGTMAFEQWLRAL
jgi:hypothetical protein